MPDNSVTLVGNITRDPELRFTQGGQAVASFGLAVNRRYQQNGEWQEKVSFINHPAWGQLGENPASSLAKGSRVIVNGRLEQRDHLLLGVDVALRATGVPALLVELGPGGDRLVDAEQLRDRGHDLLRRGRHEEDTMAPALVGADAIESFVVHDRLDHVSERVAHDLADLRLVPPLREREDGLAELLELLR